MQARKKAPNIAAIKNKLPNYVLTAFYKLYDAGFEAYIVGGCIRDLLLGKTPLDYDICTSATPDEIIRAMHGFKVIKTGIAHGTVTAIIDSMPVEITTYRIDGEYTDFRHPETVDFTSSLKDDLSRRDFTINAMAYSPVSGFSDPFGGLSGLKNRIIKCVGDADARFNQDALRIMRALRFHATLGYSLEARTKSALLKHTPLLNNIAKERICAELKRLLTGRYAADTIKEFSTVIFEIIPELNAVANITYNNNFIQENLWGKVLTSLSNSPDDLTIRLALLLSDIGKPSCHTTDEEGNDYFYGHAAAGGIIAGSVLRRLKFERKIVNRVVKLIESQDIELVCDKDDIRIKLAEFGVEVLQSLIEMQLARNNSNEIYFREMQSMIFEILAENPCLSVKDLDISGRDIIALGVEKGERVGEILTRLFNEVLNQRLVNKKEALTEKARRLISE